MSAWTDHVNKWKDCNACELCMQRDRIVLARGSVPADILFVGEAPGASENALGQPFVGPAGHLLDQIIGRAVPVGIPYALTNLVACFPQEAKAQGHNEPTHSEILTCRPRLIEFAMVCRPRLIVTVGKLANTYFHKGALETYGQGVTFVTIDHPAYILRMPLAQKGYAVQKAIVILRNAVDAMVQSGNTTKWEAGHAENKPQTPIAQYTDDDADIPF